MVLQSVFTSLLVNSLYLLLDIMDIKYLCKYKQRAVDIVIRMSTRKKHKNWN